MTTYYQYDLLDDLTGVCQGGTWSGSTCSGGQGRGFSYDFLGRLLTASNPETGNVTGGDTTYTYDDNGNMQTRTMAANVAGKASTLTVSYDALNRPYKKLYSGLRTASNVTLCYDGLVYGNSDGVCTLGTVANAKMRLTEVRNSLSSTQYTAYDARGRVTG